MCNVMILYSTICLEKLKTKTKNIVTDIITEVF